ncbi:MAG TPA: hypothetical protein VKN64_04480 [Halanaerobiales bacterium]|nr:hypothetical protein [Halanaerobiales bacterium]
MIINKFKTLFLKTGGEYKELPLVGEPARVQYERKKFGKIDNVKGYLTGKIRTINLPPQKDNIIYIVSFEVLTENPERADLFTPFLKVKSTNSLEAYNGLFRKKESTPLFTVIEDRGYGIKYEIYFGTRNECEKMAFMKNNEAMNQYHGFSCSKDMLDGNQKPYNYYVK